MLRAGAAVRLRQLAGHPALRGSLLAAAARHVGVPPIRVLATVGGNFCHGHPTAELPLAALVAGASLAGFRRDGTEVRFTGPELAALRPAGDRSEVLLTALEWPVHGNGHVAGFAELGEQRSWVPAAAVAWLADRRAAPAQPTPQARIGVALRDGGRFLLSRAEGAPARLRRSGRPPPPSVSRPTCRPAGWPISSTSCLAKTPSRKGCDPVTTASRTQAAQTGDRAGAGAARSGTAGGSPAAMSGVSAGSVEVNGTVVPLDDVPANWTLADLLRYRTSLRGTHLACERGVCGVCTVLLDGAPVRSFLLLSHAVRDRQVTTVEGLDRLDAGLARRLRAAFVARNAFQCGFCTPGMLALVFSAARDAAGQGDSGAGDGQPQRPADMAPRPGGHRRQHLPVHRVLRDRGRRHRCTAGARRWRDRGPGRMTGSFWLAASGAKNLAVRQVSVDGVDTRVIEAGEPDAPPLVCLHGTGGHAEAFVYNLAALANRHHVLAYDLPAHGWSSAPERSYEIDGYRRHLHAFLDAFALPQATLIGQSLGGWIAAAYAAGHPERVTRLVLVGAGGSTFDPAVMERLRVTSMAAVQSPTEELIRSGSACCSRGRKQPARNWWPAGRPSTPAPVRPMPCARP